MNVLLLNQFYPPDLAPTGALLSDVAELLAERGHGVRVICSRGAYAAPGAPAAEPSQVAVERVGGSGSGRRGLPGRALDAVRYAAGAWRRARRGPPPQVLVALTSPPLLGLLARRIARRTQAACAHWVMDLYPDALVAARLLAPDSTATRALRRLARDQYRGARLVLAPGAAALARLEPWLEAATERCAVSPWGRVAAATPEQAAAERVRRGWPAGETVLLYSGNAGRAHSFVEFLAAAGRLGRDGPRWVFAGAGPRRRELERARAAQPAARIELEAYVPERQLAALLSAADVHLVSLAPGWQGISVPSKLAAAFAVGRPVLFVGPADCEPGRWVESSGGGWRVDAGDLDGLLAALAAARDPEQRRRRGDAAAAWARVHFDRQRSAARVADLIEGCVPAPRGA